MSQSNSDRGNSDIAGYSLIVPLDVVNVPVRPLKVLPTPPKSGKPIHVRSVSQMHAFAQHVASNHAVREHGMVADPGLGKSTKFPLMLAKKSKQVVLLIEFCGSLAECISEGLTKYRDATEEFKSVAITYHDAGCPPDLADARAPHVIVISARRLLGRIAMGRTFPEVIALHDESHYSDYSAYTWRNVARELPWVKATVAMSATLSPSVRADGTSIDGEKFVRREVVMPIPPVKNWIERAAPADAAYPWAIDALANKKTLIFSEDRVSNKGYAKILSKSGIAVFHLEVGHTPKFVRSVRQALTTDRGAVVVFADAAYRNGYNFNLDTVIDCGLVREEYMVDEKVIERYRPANLVEILQGTARVGRSKPGTVYRDNADYPTHIPMLALGEVNHAAALHILVGFKPPKVLCDLKPEVEQWDLEVALSIVRGGLRPVKPASVSDVDRRDAKEPIVQLPSGAGPARPVPVSAIPSLGDVVEQARSFNLQGVSVDDAFPLNHPGVRYDVPRSFLTVPNPYWVETRDAERMMRKLLSDQGRYDVDMLSVPEVQWFAAQLTGAWNDAADAIVERSTALSAVDVVMKHDGKIHAHMVSNIQRVQQEIALHVRELEAIMDLLRRFYIRRPFLVQARDISSAPVMSNRYESAKIVAENICIGPNGRMAESVRTREVFRLEPLLADNQKPYFWSRPEPRGSGLARLQDGSYYSGSSASGSR